MRHINKHADFDMILRVTAPDTAPDTPEIPAEPVPVPDLSAVEMDMWGAADELRTFLPAYSNGRYSHPCTGFTLQHAEEDAPRVKAWFSGDYSEVTGFPSASLTSTLSRTINDVLKNYYAAAARAGRITAPVKTGMAVRLGDGSRLPIGRELLIFGNIAGPSVAVRSYTPAPTMTTAYVEIFSTPFTMYYEVSAEAGGTLLRQLEGLHPVAVDFYSTAQAALAPDPLSCSGLRTMTFGEEKLRGFVYDVYESGYVADRIAADTDFRIIGSMDWADFLENVGRPTRVPLNAGALPEWSRQPRLTWEADPVPPEEDPQEPDTPQLVGWEAEVFTTDIHRAFRASMDAEGRLRNAVPNPDGSFRLLVHGHRLECGPVRCRFTPWLRDSEFPQGARREPVNIPTDIVLWDGNTDAPTFTAEVAAALPLYQGPPGERGQTGPAAENRVIASHRPSLGPAGYTVNRYLATLCVTGDGISTELELFEDIGSSLPGKDRRKIPVIFNNTGPRALHNRMKVVVSYDAGNKVWVARDLQVSDVVDRLPRPDAAFVAAELRRMRLDPDYRGGRLQFQTRVPVVVKRGAKKGRVRRWSRKFRLHPGNRCVFRARRIRMRGGNVRPRHRNKIASEWVVFSWIPDMKGKLDRIIIREL